MAEKGRKKQKTALDDPSLSRVPPQNLEAEESLLASVLVGESVLPVIMEHLEPGDFYSEANRKIFGAMLDLFGRGEPTDIITIGNQLKRKKELEAIGGYPYLARLNEEVPVAVNAPHYAKIVKDKAILRRLIEQAHRIVRHCFEEDDDVREIVDFAENAIFSVSDDENASAISPVTPLLHESLQKIGKRKDDRSPLTGVPTPFPDMDRKTSGFQPGALIILAARPGMGKTALALNFASHAAKKGEPVLFFSLEMSNDQLVERVLCAEARVNAWNVRGGYLNNDDYGRLRDAVGNLDGIPLFLDDSGMLTALDVRAKARRIKKEKGLSMIIVDYLQLMKGPSEAERRDLEISFISRSLKSLAKELSVPIIALSQLNRKIEGRENKRPMLSDLRESGALEQDADMVMFINREDKDAAGEADKSQGKPAELIIAKHRQGSPGTVNLFFFGEYTRFEEAERDR
ncbi:MAG: replicative DNA helicase [Deltaproteobacteria bacterium]|nr:replicative DNA helicase [Deltaproteobacteria bacterium]